MVKPSETRQCVLCPKLRDPDSGVVVEVAGHQAWVCDECKAEFYRIRVDELVLKERLAQPGWLATELPPNSDVVDDVKIDDERTERERDEE